jgi:hypothetical protein
MAGRSLEKAGMQHTRFEKNCFRLLDTLGAPN